ncbi:restriction endonuclease subunit S, partial [bacterium]|nr:restriction endonuclease subunit S [bacterium]
MSWEYKNLSEVCSIAIGKTPSRSNKSYWDVEKKTNNVWLSIADISSAKSKTISNSKEYVSDIGASLFKPVVKGTLLMSFKLSLGKLAYAGTDLRTNEAIVALPIKNSMQLLNEFLYYYLSFYDWDKEAGNDIKVKGKTLNKEKLKNIKVPLPPLPTQQTIVAKLDALSEEVTKSA